MPVRSRLKSASLPRLLAFDAEIQAALPSGTRVIGLDEVGRGSLIGPVVAAAVCFGEPFSPVAQEQLAILNDSKQLTAERRQALSDTIWAVAQVGIGEASCEEVDRLNVHQASLLAAFRAYQALCRTHPPSPGAPSDFLLMDGRSPLPEYPRHAQRAIIKGDGQSAVIAAASVIAKCHRDAWVGQLALDFPGYGWERNMGYGVPEHLAALARLGPTLHHRRGFKGVRDAQLSFSLEVV